MEQVQENMNSQGGSLKSAKAYDEPEPKSSSGKLAWLAVILSVLSLIGLVAVGHKIKSMIGEINQTVTTLQTQAATNTKTMAEFQTTLDDQKAQLFSFQQLSTGSSAAWHIAEAKYLVDLANYQMTFIKDVPAAISLLQTADQQIASINDPSLTPIRQLTANYIANLQAIPKIDYAGLLIRITALQTQVNRLPTLGLPKATVMDSNEDNQTSPLRRAIHDSWVTLQKIIVIRKDDIGIQPLLSPEQQTYLQQNLQLILQQAQWAALRNQQDVYMGSLKQAYTWILRYFAKNNPATQAYLKALNDLMQINVQPQLPDLSPLVKAMQQVATPQTKQGG